MARIAVGGFRHLTNSFAPTRAGWDDLEKGQGGPPLLRGQALADAFAPDGAAIANLPAAGMLEAIAAAGHEPVPLAWASSGAAGPMLTDAFDKMIAVLLEELAACGPVDAVCLDLAGAMVTETGTDGDAETAMRIRGALAPGVPVAVALDRRGNVSPALVAAAGLVLPGSGAEAGRRLVRAALDRLLGDRGAPVAAVRPLPFLVPPAWPVPPGWAEPAAANGADVALGLALGFPYADVAHAGPAVIAWGMDAAVAGAAAESAAARLAGGEIGWPLALLDPAAAVAAALAGAHTGRPCLLLDVQDDPGAGATGDGTALLRALLDAGATDAALGLLFDPHVATLAHKAGVGGRIRVALGGKHGIPGERPFEGEFEVVAAPDLPVVAAGPVLGRASVDLSPFAALAIGGVRVAVSGRPVEAVDRAFFRACGIFPESLRVLALKSGAGWQADFGGIAARVLRVRSPGAAPADPAGLPYRRLRGTVRLAPGGATLDEARPPGADAPERSSNT